MENENTINQNPRPKIILIIVIVVVVLVLSVLVFYLVKKPSVPSVTKYGITPSPVVSTQNILTTPLPNGPFKYPANVTPPTKFKGTFPLILSDNGFSEKAYAMMKGSSVILVNSSSKDARITITDAKDKILDTVLIPTQKVGLPITYDKEGTYKFKDSTGNTAVIVITL